MLFLDLVSRLIGTHELFVLNYYPYLARFLSPHQREVVRMLQFAAQAAHALVPPDDLEPVVRAIVNNFVTERNAAEVSGEGEGFALHCVNLIETLLEFISSSLNAG